MQPHHGWPLAQDTVGLLPAANLISTMTTLAVNMTLHIISSLSLLQQ